ncbi:MAG: type II secretion system GspH family protein [Erysipelothrix sp.]|nr:type II secretion system GspH family protein [Erysipelothrix sp.]
MKKLNKKGFTLIELIVVIGILAILALILVPSIANYLGQAKTARNDANARALYSEIMLDAATGQLGVSVTDATIVGGTVTCTYSTNASAAVTAFSCVSSDGSVSVTFAP